MKIIYTIKTSETTNSQYIEALYDDGRMLAIPVNPENSDYQRYLRWLENPDADESGTLQ